MEILEEEAEKRGLERGFEKGMVEEKERNEVKNVLRLHSKNYDPLQISDLLDLQLERVKDIIQKSTLNEFKH
jgi:predicted transposase YdaD